MRMFGDHIFILAQIIGFIAAGISAYAFSRHDEQKVRLYMGLQSILVAIHFFMLGRLNGCFSAGISSVRNFVSMHGKMQILAWPFIIFYLVMGIYGYEQWFDVLPIGASILSTYNYFFLDGRIFRIILVLVSFMWLIHNVLAYSWGMTLMETTLMIIGIRTYYQLYGSKKEEA